MRHMDDLRVIDSPLDRLLHRLGTQNRSIHEPSPAQHINPTPPTP
jgi:hypothetical protein